MLRELGYLKTMIFSNLSRLNFPHKISYVTTYRCNLRCKICNIWRKKTIGELSLEEINKFFRKSNAFFWVGITGGEPFLREDMSEIIKTILDNCFRLVALHFATNGTLTDRIINTLENILRYKKPKVKLLFTLSIDGPPNLHDEIRGVSGAWFNCINTFKELKKDRFIQAKIGITLSSFNLTNFKETFESLKTAYPLLRFDDIGINIFHKSSFYYNNENMPDLDFARALKEIDRILDMDKDALSINNFLRRRYLKLYKRYMQTKKCPLKCQALSATCVLDPQGYVYPCGIYAVNIANIKEHNYDLRKIWSKPYVKELSIKCSKSVCPSCWSPCDAYSAIVGSLFRFNLWRS